MGFEPMILFNILVQQTNALNRSATYFFKIKFYPATGSPTTTMLRLRPGYYPYGQTIIIIFYLKKLKYIIILNIDVNKKKIIIFLIKTISLA